MRPSRPTIEPYRILSIAQAPRFGWSALDADLAQSLSAALDALLVLAQLDRLGDAPDLAPEDILRTAPVGASNSALDQLRDRLTAAGNSRLRLAAALAAILGLRAIESPGGGR